MLNSAGQQFETMPLGVLIRVAIAINMVMFLVAVGGGEFLAARFRERRCAPSPPPLSATEVLSAVVCVALNAAVMVVGALLLQRGAIRLAYDHSWWRSLVDTAVLMLAMDFGMYVSHRVAHHRWIHPWLHRTHHDHPHPRPLTLFVLSPWEVFGFGALWLVVIALYPASPDGMALYLLLNLAFGTIGHLGVEPFPHRWQQSPWTRWISTSTFHAGHHLTPAHNFGFYTLVWDWLFGTLQPSTLQETTDDRRPTNDE